MCRSAPPRISAVDRLLLLDEEQQQPLLPFENAPMINAWQQQEAVPWDQESTEEDDDDIQNDLEQTTTVMSPPGGADYYYHDDYDFEADEVRYHTGEEYDPEEEDRQLEVWRGLTRPRDNDDWRSIFERFSGQMALITGVQQPFREWESAWGPYVN
jgi:hypothetical protein